MSTNEEPVTVIITRTLLAGREAAFEEAVRVWIHKALTYPGYLGVHMLRPAPGGQEYGAVLKFATQANWDSFRASPEYLVFLAEIQEHLTAAPKVETVTGLESWFTAPGARVVRVPPRWKMAVVTWLGVNLTAIVLTFVIKPLLAGLPQALGFVTFNACVVTGLTWAVMPALSRLFRGWLLPPDERK